MPQIARLTVDDMKAVLRRIAALEKEELPPESFEAKGRAIFTEQRIKDAPLIEAFMRGLS